MGMRGRPPKATKLHVIQGTDRPHRMKHRAPEPVVEGAIGQPPESLSDELERAVWHEIASVASWLTPADRSTLETFCRLKALERRNFLSMTGAQLSGLNKLSGLMGLNPSERSRVKMPEPPKISDDDAFFGTAYSA